MRLFVIGASGAVGSRIVAFAASRGHDVTAQSRGTIEPGGSGHVSVAQGSPMDGDFLRRQITGHDAVLYALGTKNLGKTTLFSDTSRVLISAMKDAGVRRLVMLTGVGVGETRGHGGWLYNWIIFPLITHNIYADKDRAEALVEASGLEWTLVRAAPFAKRADNGPLRVETEITPRLQLSAITHDEVARFMVDEAEKGAFVGRKPSIGHGG